METIIASIPSAIGPKILKAEVISMNSFTELSISQFRDLISASPNCTSPLDIIPTHLVKSFPDHYFLELLKLLNISLKADVSPSPLKWPLLSPTWGKQNLTMTIFQIIDLSQTPDFHIINKLVLCSLDVITS